jgi:broad specificity phosphatase PhoE
VIRVALIRHGITAWNRAGRIQGRSDVPLCEEGRAQVRSWRLPEDLEGARLIASPLGRARETARLLTGREPPTDARLMEMDWGAFEGRRLSELRAEDRAGFAANEARGLDFRPPGGESPREVAARLAALLAELTEGPVVLVAHRGVLRAAVVLATGWDMRGPPPLEPARDEALLVDLRPAPRLAGRLALGPS